MDAVWRPLSYWVKRPESDINKAKDSDEKERDENPPVIYANANGKCRILIYSSLQIVLKALKASMYVYTLRN